MTTSPDRLDRIERILETVVIQQVELTARQTAFQAQLEQQNDELEQEFEFIGTSLSRLEQQVSRLAQQSEQDRNQANIDRAEFRSTVEQLLRVLTQQFNGNGHE